MNMTDSATGYHTRAARVRTASPAELALLVAVIIALFAAAWLSGHPVASDVRTRPVRVGVGETLWSIARNNPAPGLSTAESARLLAEINGLQDSAVVAGEVLQVPAGNESPGSQLALR